MREEGYYWTRTGNEWEICYYGESWRGYKEWSWAGHELWYGDDVFDEIDENRITKQSSDSPFLTYKP